MVTMELNSFGALMFGLGFFVGVVYAMIVKWALK